MTKEEQEALLEQAKIRFPIGTKFKCPVFGYEGSNRANSVHSHNLYFTERGNRITAHGMYYLYDKGKWAERINSNVKEIEYYIFN